MNQEIRGEIYMDNLFECNLKNFKKKNNLLICDNFYKNPDKIMNIINNNNPEFHKKNQPGYNGKYFFDKRHSLEFNELIPTVNKLEKLINKTCDKKNIFFTNIMKFKKCSFNDYNNYCWWPHKDMGMTAIIYFNNHETNGTNIYEENKEDRYKMLLTKEHKEPWRLKKYWKIKNKIIPKFNRCVIFNSLDFHGCNIENDLYFNEYRINQVIFFK